MADNPFAPMDPMSQLPPELLMQLLGRQQISGAPTGLPDAGLGPVTDASRAGLPNAQASPFAPTDPIQSALDYGAMPAQAYMGQIDKAARAASEATDDPSISNIANTGIQAGAALGMPSLMLPSAALGYGNAALEQFGPGGLTSSAHAQQRKKGKAAPVEVPDLPGLPPEMQPAYKDVKRKLESKEWMPRDTRRSLAEQMNQFMQMSAQQTGRQGELDAEKARAAQAEYDRRVQTAEGARDRELGRDMRWIDTPVGSFMEKTGGLTPMIAALGAGGALGKIQKTVGSAPKTMAGKFLSHEVAPFTVGSMAAFAMNNVPDGYNATYAPTENPQMRALEEYGRELPAGHPRKEESLAEADKIRARQPTNPIRDQAVSNLTDPKVLKSRGVFSLMEGTTAPLAAGLVRGKPPGPHVGTAPGSMTPEQRASALKAAREARASHKADFDARRESPATEQWFKDNPGSMSGPGSVQRLRAFNEANGTNYSRAQLDALERAAQNAGRQRGVQRVRDEIMQQAQQARQQGGEAAALWDAIATGKTPPGGLRATRDALVAQYPELGHMSAKAINQMLREAATGSR